MQYAIYMVVGLVAGFSSSLLGIGGGVVLVPMLLLIFRLPAHVATATSLAYIAPVALYGALIHVVGEDVQAHRHEIERVLREVDVTVRTIDLIAPSLEDVFIANVRQNGDNRESPA